jgi:hypothetical protein
MKTIITFFAVLSLSFTALAQNSIKGRVIDENDKPVSYSTVVLLNPVDSILKYFGVTNDEGFYQIKSIKPGKYVMQVSFEGMETFSEHIEIPSEKGENFGDTKLKASPFGEVDVEEVIVEGEYIPIEFKSDTVEYNADAFKTKEDAVVEDLLKKIPGIEVDESGNMKAHGEDVKKVLVDGKEFFGDDPKVATKNLPAKAVKKVQVYDKQSLEAEFMNIDDGERDRTINLLLNKDHKKGYFGDIEVGAGTEDYYKAEGKIYRFSSKLQSAVLGMYNNINEFGFTHEGRGRWGQQLTGLNKTLAGGVNLSYNVSETKRYFFSYLASNVNTNLIQNTETENFLETGSYTQVEELTKNQNNTPHKINFGIRHKFNENHNLILDGDVNISSNEVENLFTKITDTNGNAVNKLESQTNTLSDVTSAYSTASYIAKLNKDKTQLKTNFKASYNNNSSNQSLLNDLTVYDPFNIENIDQYQNNNTEDLSLSVNPGLVQKLKNFWNISANMKMGLKDSRYIRTQGNVLENIEIDSLGADFSSVHSFLNPELSIRRATAKSQFSITFGVGWDQLDNDLLNSAVVQNKTYFNLFPSISYRNQYKQGRRIGFRYNTRINMPSVSQLLPVVNTINPLSLYEGNLDLTPEYRHDLSIYWSIFDQFSFTALFARLGSSYTDNKIGISQMLNEDYTKIIKPVNVDYDYSAYAFVYFSTPLRPLGIKINLRSHESWNKGISLIDSEENVNTSLTHSVRFNIENRNKEKWHGSIGGSISHTTSKFSVAESMNNVYFNTSYFSEISYTPTDKWTFEADGKIVNYSSQSFAESFSIPLLNASISYYFLKKNKASLTILASDILNKSTGISQVTEASYIMQQESNTLVRYFMLKFRYRIGKNPEGGPGRPGGRRHRH